MVIHSLFIMISLLENLLVLCHCNSIISRSELFDLGDLGPSQASTMEFFYWNNYRLKLKFLTIRPRICAYQGVRNVSFRYQLFSQKGFIIDVWLSPKYASASSVSCKTVRWQLFKVLLVLNPPWQLPFLNLSSKIILI